MKRIQSLMVLVISISSLLYNINTFPYLYVSNIIDYDEVLALSSVFINISYIQS